LLSATDKLIAYYTCDEIVESGTLDASISDQVKRTLPAHLHPAEYIALDQLPRLPNGKIDVNSLPEPTSRLHAGRDERNSEVNSALLEKSDVSVEGDIACEPLSEKLLSLIAILETLLDIDGILPTDNYFEIGGDSITAIRLVSRAREAGVNISVSSLAKYPDFRQLVNSIDESARTMPAEGNSPYGDAPVTPIQAWFFSQHHPRPEHWCIGGRYLLDKGTDNELLVSAIRACLAEHRELGVRFHYAGNRWQCNYPDNAPPDNIVRIEDSGEFPSITELVKAGAEGFNLASGWMLNFIVVNNTLTGTGELVWVAHHLLVDQISVATLIREIENRYRSREIRSSAGNDIMSMRNWAVTCDQFVTSDLQINRSSGIEFSPFYSQTSATEGSVVRIEQSLDAATTKILLNIAEHRYCSMPAVLITALCVAWQSVFENTVFPLDIEGHGRDLVSTELDNSNTVGWFSAFHPVDLQMSSPASLSIEQCEYVQQQLDEQKRLNSQYLVNCVKVNEECFSNNGRLLFNYLGVSEALSEDSLFVPQSLPPAGLRSDENFRSHNLEVNVLVADNILTIVWACSVKGEVEEKSTQLIDSFYWYLVELSKACSASSSDMQTDFADINMNQSDLNDFLDSLD